MAGDICADLSDDAILIISSNQTRQSNLFESVIVTLCAEITQQEKEQTVFREARISS